MPCASRADNAALPVRFWRWSAKSWSLAKTDEPPSRRSGRSAIRSAAGPGKRARHGQLDACLRSGRQ
jgi:hypothetical protein